MDADTRRVMPHSLDAEKAVLGALLYNNGVSSEAAEILLTDGTDFYLRAHRIIFKTIMSVLDHGSVADLITTIESLKSEGNLEKVGGPAYVAELVDSALPSNIKHYAQIVKDKANDRRIIETAYGMIELVHSGQVEEAVANAQKLSIERGGKSSIRLARDVAKATMAQIEVLYNRGGEVITGLSAGLKDFDNLTGGLQNGELIIIAARPAMGKSALAGHIAKHAALNGIPTELCSLEMSGESIMMRFLAGMTDINSRQLRRGFVQDRQWPDVVNSVSRIGDSPLFIDDKSDITPAEIRAKARRLKAEHNLGLLIVDYIQLVHVPGRHETREQQVSEISRTLKAIARELNIPVIGLSQLNRQVDSRANRRPLLSDLRESGAIEQDADVIAFIYRDEVYNKNPDNPERGKAEIDVAKHRSGPSGMVRVRFDTATQTFSDLGA